MTDRRVLASACVVLVVVVAYAPTLDNYFVQDDFGVVWLLSRAPADAFSGWFVTSWMDNIWGYTPDEIRPFVAVTYQVAARFGAGSLSPITSSTSPFTQELRCSFSRRR